MTKHRIAVLLLAPVLALGLAACAKKPTVYNNRFLAFGTIVDISLYGVDAATGKSLSGKIQRQFDQENQRWHAWHRGPLVTINEALAKGQTVPIAPDLAKLIRVGRRLSDASGGLFNPAIGDLLRIWGFESDDHDQHRPPPPEAEIRKWLAQAPTMDDITISGGRISSTNPNAWLDLGGFAKGYAVGQAVRLLQRHGVANAIVNAGGDLQAIGRHGDRPWRVGIRDPRGNGILASVEPGDGESVFTSGDYERYFEYQGHRYHHILDPRSGAPAPGATSVTVITDDPARADAAATALFVAGPKGWWKVAKSMGIRYVMMIDHQGRVLMNPAMAKRVHFEQSPNPVVLLSKPL